MRKITRVQLADEYVEEEYGPSVTPSAIVMDAVARKSFLAGWAARGMADMEIVSAGTREIVMEQIAELDK